MIVTIIAIPPNLDPGGSTLRYRTRTVCKSPYWKIKIPTIPPFNNFDNNDRVTEVTETVIGSYLAGTKNSGRKNLENFGLFRIFWHFMGLKRFQMAIIPLNYRRGVFYGIGNYINYLGIDRSGRWVCYLVAYTLPIFGMEIKTLLREPKL